MAIEAEEGLLKQILGVAGGDTEGANRGVNEALIVPDDFTPSRVVPRRRAPQQVGGGIHDKNLA